MAGPTGIEPATSGVTGRRSNRLNYSPVMYKKEKLIYIISKVNDYNLMLMQKFYYRQNNADRNAYL